MLEGIICPACESTLEEEELKESLSCPKCKTDLKDRKFLDFLEYLMTNGIVEDLDFFDADVYSEDIEDLDQTEEEDVNPLGPVQSTEELTSDIVISIVPLLSPKQSL